MSGWAYVLIETVPGSATEVADELKALEGVEAADPITGPCDVVVKIYADTLHQLHNDVLKRVQDVPGITRTVTCSVGNASYPRLEAARQLMA